MNKTIIIMKATKLFQHIIFSLIFLIGFLGFSIPNQAQSAGELARPSRPSPSIGGNAQQQGKTPVAQCVPTLKRWSDQHQTGTANSSGFAYVGSVFISDTARSVVNACQQMIYNTGYFRTGEDLNKVLKEDRIGKRISKDAKSLLDKCSFENDQEQKLLTSKYYFGLSRFDSELQKINNELLAQEEYGKHLFKNIVPMNCLYGEFVAIQRSCEMAKDKCGANSKDNLDSYNAELKEDLNILKNIRDKKIDLEKQKKSLEYQQTLGIAQYVTSVKPGKEEDHKALKKQIALLEFQETILLEKHPVLMGDQFKKYSKSDFKALRESDELLEGALKTQIVSDRGKLLARKKELIQSSLCFTQPSRNCTPAQIDKALEQTSPPTVYANSPRVGSQIEAQSCVQESVNDRNQTAKTLGVSAVGAVGGVGSLAIKGVAGLGAIARSANAIRFTTLSAMTGQGAYLGLEIQEATKSCSSTDVKVPDSEKSTSMCPQNFKVETYKMNTWASCMLNEVGVAAGLTAIPGLMLLKEFKNAGSMASAVRGAKPSAQSTTSTSSASRSSLGRAASSTSREGALSPTVLRNSQLSDADRIAEAEKVLGRKLSESQRKALLEAHYTGTGEAGKNGSMASVGNYTRAQLDRKARVLEGSGFSLKERGVLLRSGLSGKSEAIDNYNSARLAKERATNYNDRLAYAKKSESLYMEELGRKGGPRNSYEFFELATTQRHAENYKEAATSYIKSYSSPADLLGFYQDKSSQLFKLINQNKDNKAMREMFIRELKGLTQTMEEVASNYSTFHTNDSIRRALRTCTGCSDLFKELETASDMNRVVTSSPASSSAVASEAKRASSPEKIAQPISTATTSQSAVRSQELKPPVATTQGPRVIESPVYDQTHRQTYERLYKESQAAFEKGETGIIEDNSKIVADQFIKSLKGTEISASDRFFAGSQYGLSSYNYQRASEQFALGVKSDARSFVSHYETKRDELLKFFKRDPDSPAGISAEWQLEQLQKSMKVFSKDPSFRELDEATRLRLLKCDGCPSP